MAKETWIYLIYDPMTRLYKVGESINPNARLNQLRSQKTLLPIAHDFQLVEAWNGTVDDERELHRRFAYCRVRGEWFQLKEFQVREVRKYFTGRARFVVSGIEPALLDPMECSGDYIDFAVEAMGIEI